LTRFVVEAVLPGREITLEINAWQHLQPWLPQR
jgi:hypothetical protein